MLDSQFWQGKRVFVTGHTGFKGSWLCLCLHQLGAFVYGYALEPPTSPSLFNESHLGKYIESHNADIRDLEQLSACMQAFQPDIVIHMAAQSLVRLSYEQPMETYSVNVMGTVAVFEAIRKCASVKAVINVTSDKCYENREWVWPYREQDPMGGYDPYSSSKGCAELVTASYRQSFLNQENGCALASVRAGNVIGGGDWACDRLVPDILKAFAAGQTVIIRNPASIRPWQHVLEPLSGYLLLAEKLYKHGAEFAQAWNFGPKEDNAKPVKIILDSMVALWGDGAHWELTNSKQVHEAHHLQLDCSKAKAKLGWHPKWSLEYSLKRTVAWHKEWLAKKDIFAYCNKEIEAYFSDEV